MNWKQLWNDWGLIIIATFDALIIGGLYILVRLHLEKPVTEVPVSYEGMVTINPIIALIGIAIVFTAIVIYEGRRQT